MKHLKIGDKAPSFSGLDGSGNKIELSDYKGKLLVIYFYPKDNTPACTVQACNLRDNYGALQEKNISIIGISMDDSKSHQKFTEKFNLPFPLIVDADRKVIDTFGVWGPKKFMGREYDGIHRTTFIIDESQTIIGIIEKPKTKAHAEEIIEILNK
jgi:peroxiredoxin Q/BCP